MALWRCCAFGAFVSRTTPRRPPRFSFGVKLRTTDCSQGRPLSVSKMIIQIYSDTHTRAHRRAHIRSLSHTQALHLHTGLHCARAVNLFHAFYVHARRNYWLATTSAKRVSFALVSLRESPATRRPSRAATAAARPRGDCENPPLAVPSPPAEHTAPCSEAVEYAAAGHGLG